MKEEEKREGREDRKKVESVRKLVLYKAVIPLRSYWGGFRDWLTGPRRPLLLLPLYPPPQEGDPESKIKTFSGRQKKFPSFPDYFTPLSLSLSSSANSFPPLSSRGGKLTLVTWCKRGGGEKRSWIATDSCSCSFIVILLGNYNVRA